MIQYLPFEKPIAALDQHVIEAAGTPEERMLAERADKLLAAGWKPRFTLEEGLAATFAFFSKW